MFGECFPERTILWEQLIESKKLSDVINSASEEYLKLYSANCASAKDKDSVLFLGWLNVFQSLTSHFVDGDARSASKATKRTLFAMILNAVYLGLCQQMAETAEKISLSSSTTSTDNISKPSDDIAMHRICGWALKSVSPDQLPVESDKLKLVKELVLSKDDKKLLPLPVQYLDRGGLNLSEA